MADKPGINDKDRADLIAYLDGELDESTAHVLEAKLGLDPGVRAEAEALRRTWDLLDYLPRPEPSPDFTNRTLERLSAQMTARTGLPRTRRWHPWAVGLGWAAALVVVGSLGYAGGAWLALSRSFPGGPADFDPQLVRDLRVIENLPLYEHVDDMDFLKQLGAPTDPDLFAEENQNS